MRTSRQSWLVIGFALLSTACGADTNEEQETIPAEQPSAAAAGMDSMPGMSAMQMGAEMTAHMERMQAMHGDSLTQMVSEHRRMLDNMMGQMNGKMQGMNMTEDPQLTALADSVRDDLVRMEQMTAADMESFMPEHHGRATRLMERHGSMMGGM